jgi:hypothetical protein
MGIGMHMHPDPMAPIRFEPRMSARASATRRLVMASGVEAGMAVRVCDAERRLWIQKTPGVQRRQASRFLAHYLAWRQEAANHHENRLCTEFTPPAHRRQAPRRPAWLSAVNVTSRDRGCRLGPADISPSLHCDRVSVREGRPGVSSRLQVWSESLAERRKHVPGGNEQGESRFAWRARRTRASSQSDPAARTLGPSYQRAVLRS